MMRNANDDMGDDDISMELEAFVKSHACEFDDDLFTPLSSRTCTEHEFEY